MEQLNHSAGRAHEPLDEREREDLSDALGQDAFQNLLADAWRVGERLRASRAIAASNANTRMLMDALKGHL